MNKEKNIINFNLELLKGCKFACEGCFVNKKSSDPLTKESYENLYHLVSDIKQNQERLHIVFIGPTDFLVSENTIEVLDSNSTYNIIQQFEKLSLQTTFLDIS